MKDLKNRDVFARDPSTWSIPNLGVTKVGPPQTPEEWEVVRYELENFVCEGEYEKGLERVLSSFLGNLDKAEQPAVWVSGFYGSGKSHFVRVLEYLWRDVEFPDGARARSLCRSLTSEIRALLTELTTAGKRVGGTWAAAGKLATGATAARLGLLSILFRAAGLPGDYPAARFVLWLKEEGRYDAVESALKATDGDGDRNIASELPNLYVSTRLAKALFAGMPGWASSPAAARDLLKTQFPMVQDVPDDAFHEAIDAVLALESTTLGKRPLTLLVFDELQQLLAEDPVRTLQVQNAVEEVSARFSSSVLFVATGQAQLQSTTQLQKLQGRFSVQIGLKDTDVDQVVRQVVLRKAETQRAPLKRLLDGVSGEIDRQLADTQIGRRAGDDEDRIADYPLLPVRRRFWEAALKAVDTAGTEGQLRTQLQLVHEATRDYADRPLGTVIPGDVVYWKHESRLQWNDALDREMANLIRELDDGTGDGILKSRLCATIFLISKLPTSGPLATGVRPTADALADLLVEDLPSGSAGLRKRIPEVLAELVSASKLLQIGDEYRLQTAEDAEWDQDFRSRLTKALSDDVRIASDRGTALRAAVNGAFKGLSLVQGKRKEPRRGDPHFLLDPPPRDSANVQIWVRDEWSTSNRVVQDEARAAGPESPIVFVSLPRLQAEELKQAIARAGALDDTCKTHTVKQTVAGQAAKAAMEAKAKSAALEVEAYAAAILKDARVYQGGGNEVIAESFATAVQQAAEAGMARLYPKFSTADNPDWAKVVTRAREGTPNPLTALGYTAETDQQPVCQEVRTYVGGAGKKGSEIRKEFTSPPYGWPQDAVDGALLAMLADGLLRVTLNGLPANVKGMTQTQIGVADFFSQTVVVLAPQKIEIRALASSIGMDVKPGEEFEAVPLILQRLAEVAAQAGGDPPLPELPDVSDVRKLQALAGNEQFVAVHTQRSQLQTWHKEWSGTAKAIASRRPEWERLRTLRAHAVGLDVSSGLETQTAAIESNRSLLTDPNPITPLLSQVTGALRSAVTDVHARLGAALDAAMATLEATAEWGRLAAEDRERLLSKYELGPVRALDVGTDEALLLALDASSLTDRDTAVDAVPTRAGKALEEAIRLLEPKASSFQVPRAMLRTEAEVQAYVKNLESELLARVSPETPVVIG